MRTISSPLAIRSRSVDTTGRPAPTLASNRKWRLLPFEQLHQRLVAAPRQRVRPFVRRDDVQVRVDERRIRVDDRRPDRAVDERRVGQLHGADPRRERVRRSSVSPRRASSRPSMSRRSMPRRSTTNRLLLASADHGDVEALATADSCAAVRAAAAPRRRCCRRRSSPSASRLSRLEERPDGWR